MLFSSSEFIFIFLPLVFAGFLLARRLQLHDGAMLWLVASSLFFYGWWNPKYLILIVVLIAVNFYLARIIVGASSPRLRKAYLIAGLVINLGTLAYFKYTNFLVQNINALTGTKFALANIVLPLGISFFTFQKIAFLIDTYHGHVKRIRLLDYSLFVLFFPQLIAGPIVHHAEVVPQFKDIGRRRLNWDHVAIGLGVFFIGLFKKVVLADSLAAYTVTPVFGAISHGATPVFLEAWGGVLGYTLQLYFDFSGYSDMAIGAALLFGIRLPQNFNSPYKSASIIDFWRRWHMTLSRFLRDYLYIALGGNRLGPVRRYINLFVTMLLGGIWHGAGWTFVVWGALHGTYLMINHGWHLALDRLFPGRRRSGSRLGKLAGVAVTFFAVMIGWVFFRADSIHSAMALLHTMFGGDGIELPLALARGPGSHSMAGGWIHFTGGSTAYGHIEGGLPFLCIALLMAWCCFLPNAQQIFARFETSLGAERVEPTSPVLQFRYGWLSAAMLSATIIVCLLYVRSNIAQEFLYFDF
jgi:D-alanyl-lipoteichoic acid acyltransferase DltB (MBOAT superfamily)